MEPWLWFAVLVIYLLVGGLLLLSDQFGSISTLCEYAVFALVLWPIVLIIGLFFHQFRIKPAESGFSAILHPLIGKTGLTVSDLKPTGRIRIGDITYEAKAATAWIAAGVEVRVVKIENRIPVVSIVGSDKPSS